MLGIKFQSLKPYWGLNKSFLLSMYDFNGADIFFFSFSSEVLLKTECIDIGR